MIKYMDDDRERGSLRDFMGKTGNDARTYDNHDGIDIGIAGWEAMDRGVAVFAGIDGIVKSAVDGYFDRNTAASTNKPRMQIAWFCSLQIDFRSSTGSFERAPFA